MSFSATDAAFEGFRVTRRNPTAVLLWAVVWLIALMVSALIAAPLIEPHMAELQAANGDINALSPEALRAFALAMTGFLPPLVLAQALVAPAVYRAVLEPEDRRFGFLRLGKVEARMLAVLLLLVVIQIALNVGADLAVRGANAVIGLAGSLVVNLVGFALGLWLSARLSLVAPLTMRRDGLPIQEGWKRTGPIVWHLIGVNVLAVAMSLLVGLLLALVAWPMMALMSGAGASAGVAALLLMMLMGLGFALITVLLWSPFAAILKQLEG
ncbi:hypothetical protein GVN18_27190 [Pseudomonas sp. ODNR1LW]|nr:hypothetical protein [Pseudomonas sp. ODNR1LW]